MDILVIRHGLSQANNIYNIGTPAYGSRDAALMEEGRVQAQGLTHKLNCRYGITTSEPVAVSTLYRTRETAWEASFTDVNEYAVLDEAEPDGMTKTELRAMLDAGNLPQFALDAAEKTLAQPPAERIWFSHGLRIAGLCALLGTYQDARLIPRFCEIRQLRI